MPSSFRGRQPPSGFHLMELGTEGERRAKGPDVFGFEIILCWSLLLFLADSSSSLMMPPAPVWARSKVGHFCGTRVSSSPVRWSRRWPSACLGLTSPYPLPLRPLCVGGGMDHQAPLSESPCKEASFDP